MLYFFYRLSALELYQVAPNRSHKPGPSDAFRAEAPCRTPGNRPSDVMPRSLIQLSSHVLVTGATGFIGAHIIDLLLNRGVKVTGTARSESKASEMSVQHAQHTNEGSFRMILTGDLTEPNAFDEAIKDVDAVIHTASVSMAIQHCEENY